jgi:hypothetical protein
VTFEEFVAARLTTLVRYATVVTWDPHLAEDITQNVLVKAQARWHRISQVDAPEQYVKRMVVNEFLSWRRLRAARLIPLARETLDGFAPPVPDPTAPRDDRDAMLRLIAMLPPRQRAAVLRGPADRGDRAAHGLPTGHRPHTSVPRSGRAACGAAGLTGRHRGATVTDNLEELVRAAVLRRADDAVPPDRIRSALPGRAAVRRRNRRRTGVFAIGAAAAAVAAAIVVPTALLGSSGSLAGGTDPGTIPARSTPAGPPATGAPAPTQITVLSPTWVPPGLTERARRTSGAGAQQTITRVWSNKPVGTDGAGGHGLTVTTQLTTDPSLPESNGMPKVDINGATGYYSGPGADEKTYVTWRSDPKTVITIGQQGLTLSETQLIRMARSFTAHLTIKLAVLKLGWVPDNLSTVATEVSGDSPGAHLAEIDLQGPVAAPPASPTGGTSPDPLAEKKQKGGGSDPDYLVVIVSPTTYAPGGGTPVTVNGHPGRLITRTDLAGTHGWYLVVTLTPHQFLTITATSQDDKLGGELTDIAQDIQVVDHIADWIGHR